MRTPLALVLATLAALLLSACGSEEAARTEATIKPASKSEPRSAKVDVLRDDTAEFPKGWTADAWQQLGGRPDDWPADLVPPVDTERARVLVQDGSGGPTTFLSGRVPDTDMTTLEGELTDRFSGWEAVDGIDVTDVIGTYERDGLHVQVTLREDGDGATYGIILSTR